MRKIHRRRYAIAALTVSAIGLPAAASGSVQLRPIVDGIMQPAATSEAIPALIVGVSMHGVRTFFSYSGTGEPLPAKDTIVEIGSITKSFTTALLAEAVQEGRISAAASIQDYLPGISLQPCARRITPVELADFTSGMPELPTDAPKNLQNRGLASYTEADFLHWAASWSPDGRCDLPAPYLYSNTSVGLLGPILARAMGARWEQLIAGRITGPLGMRDTVISVEPTKRNRLAQGHDPAGKTVIPWPVFAWYAAGALRSTAPDMLSFGEAALGHPTANGNPVPRALSDAFRLAMTSIYQPAGEPFQQAMSWAIEPDGASGTMVYKNGGTDGFNSFIVVDAAKDMVIFVVANKAKAGVPKLGKALMQAIP